MSTEERKISREVTVKLTQGELADLGTKAGARSSELSGLKGDFDTVKKEWKGKIGAVEAELNDALKKLQEGTETKLMEVREVKDFALNTVKYYRTDTDELIEERALTGEERQKEMFPGEAPKEGEIVGPEGAQDAESDLQGVMAEETSRSKVGMLEQPA